MRKVSAGGWRLEGKLAFQAVGAHMQRGMEVYNHQHAGYGKSKTSEVEKGQRA